VEFIRRDDVKVFANSGVTSHQLLFPENSTSARVTITRVVVQPGAVNSRHRHATSEQIWVALSGSGRLLLAGELTAPFAAGDIVRFEDGETHGLENTGSSPFEYLSVTAPPLNFRAAYATEWHPKS
jgi:mannose-6-phosphate isomerase-like protein (cupin superfamily)